MELATFRIEPSLLARLRENRVRHGVTVTAQVTQALRRFLGDDEPPITVNTLLEAGQHSHLFPCDKTCMSRGPKDWSLEQVPHRSTVLSPEMRGVFAWREVIDTTTPECVYRQYQPGAIYHRLVIPIPGWCARLLRRLGL
jgi:hypothetical protein